MPDTILTHISGMNNASPVEEMLASSLCKKVFVENYVNKSRPCVIKGAVSHWPAARKWVDEKYLSAVCGEYKISLFPHQNYLSPSQMKIGERKVKFSEALAHFHSAETEVASSGCVLMGSGSKAKFSELLSDIEEFPFLGKTSAPLFFPRVRFFFYRNAGTSWHQHPLDETLMCQVVGSKKVGLLKDDALNHSAMKELFHEERYYEDPSAFDRMKVQGLSWLLATVDEGDALYLPPLWWHGVIPSTKTFGITVPICWRSPLHVIGDITSPTVRVMWKEAWRKAFYSRRFYNLSLTRRRWYLVASLPARVLHAFLALCGY